MTTASILLWSLGAPEIIIIAIVVLLFFGGKKIPELMRGLGRGIRDFKNAKEGIESEITKEIKKYLIQRANFQNRLKHILHSSNGSQNWEKRGKTLRKKVRMDH